ncbi:MULTISPECIES: N-acetyltransferase [unclassified Rhizobacter]|uniref:GNAT family N-acetyltransferase n=1 Tax=unclassified Rhizobacter TaxID=2640088 RepID=UPI0006F3011E|nr:MULTISPECIES: GNAT family N-acetyltransferase [unclassified Rhizobacter]KQU81093.1 GCN5 family acetyltransferase [Rhizobacter sp. Root29]KQW04637.1 GCN5 family acetyltransferase [Rhizobacter sp. Root1238]KRB06476.1 GCN5 family acetyltransferase [Rhizobacter sp. Root16D2]
MSLPFSIDPLHSDAFDPFAAYLADHVADNGRDGLPLFQPLARAESRFDGERARAFRDALDVSLFEPGWRRAWVARLADGLIIGHVDLRARPEAHTTHRCILGMGVDPARRRAGVGAGLLAHARDWARSQPALDWIDLQVLSSNDSAIRLYRRSGFVDTGELVDLFRIEGRSMGFRSMALRLMRDGH